MGDSNTRCSASVSSTAPRLEPRWPPVSATAGDDEVADLAGEFVEFAVGQIAEVVGFVQALEVHLGSRRYLRAMSAARSCPGSRLRHRTLAR